MAEKCNFSGEFSRISGSKRSLAVCITVVSVGILQLRSILLLKIATRCVELHHVISYPSHKVLYPTEGVR